jgi:hypothetical protein
VILRKRSFRSRPMGVPNRYPSKGGEDGTDNDV